VGLRRHRDAEEFRGHVDGSGPFDRRAGYARGRYGTLGHLLRLAIGAPCRNDLFEARFEIRKQRGEQARSEQSRRSEVFEQEPESFASSPPTAEGSFPLQLDPWCSGAAMDHNICHNRKHCGSSQQRSFPEQLISIERTDRPMGKFGLQVELEVLSFRRYY